MLDIDVALWLKGFKIPDLDYACMSDGAIRGVCRDPVVFPLYLSSLTGDHKGSVSLSWCYILFFAWKCLLQFVFSTQNWPFFLNFIFNVSPLVGTGFQASCLSGLFWSDQLKVWSYHLLLKDQYVPCFFHNSLLLWWRNWGQSQLCALNTIFCLRVQQTVNIW